MEEQPKMGRCLGVISVHRGGKKGGIVLYDMNAHVSTKKGMLAIHND